MIPDGLGVPEFVRGLPVSLRALQQTADIAFEMGFRRDGLGGDSRDSASSYGFDYQQRPQFWVRLTDYQAPYYSWQRVTWTGTNWLDREDGESGTLNATDETNCPRLRVDSDPDVGAGNGEVVWLRLADCDLETGSAWKFLGWNWSSVTPGASNQFWTTNPPADDVQWSGGRRLLTTSTTLDLADHLKLIDVDASLTNVTVSLPAAASAQDGWSCFIRRTDSNTATLVTIGAGASSYFLHTSAQCFQLRCVVGTGWEVVSRNGPFLVDLVGSPPAVRYTHPINFLNFSATTGVLGAPQSPGGALISLLSATPTQMGAVDTVAQSFAGLKTFTDGLYAKLVKVGPSSANGYTSLTAFSVENPSALHWTIRLGGNEATAITVAGDITFARNGAAGTQAPVFQASTSPVPGELFSCYDTWTAQTAARFYLGLGGAALDVFTNKLRLAHLTGSADAAYWIENDQGVTTPLDVLGFPKEAYAFKSRGGLVIETDDTIPAAVVIGSLDNATIPAANIDGSIPPASGGTGADLSGAASGSVVILGTGGVQGVAAGLTWDSTNSRLNATSLSINNTVVLENDASNTLALRRDTTPQRLRVYKTWTDASNGEWLDAGLNGSTFELMADANGSGSQRALRVGTHGAVALVFATNGTDYWQVNGSGALQAATDNVSDIGSAASARPRDFYLGRNAVIGGNLDVSGTATLIKGANGQALRYPPPLEELLTIASGPTSDTAFSIPAGAIILAVSVRVVTTIPDATTFTVTGATSGTVFSTGAVSVAAGSTNRGTAAGAYYNATAQKVRITPNVAPGPASGEVRVTVHYLECVVPVS